MRSKIRSILIVVVIIGFMFLPIVIASTDNVPEPSDAPEDVPKLDPSVPDLDAEEQVEENKDLLNCLCRCLEPKGGKFSCRYNTTDKGSSPSCADPSNGPCICQGIVGCFRGPLPTEGECYERCQELYETSAEKDTSPKLDSSPPSPGEPGSRGAGFSTVEREPNDLIGDANEIKFASPVFVKGQITPAGDVDFYKFYVDTPGILQVKLDDVPSNMRSRIDLYGKNFNWITRKDASNAGDAITLQKDISGPGWHYFAISDLGRKVHTDEYSFEANFEPAQDPNEPNSVVGDATEIELGQTVQGYVCPVDDVDFYKFHVDTSGILQVKLDNVPSDLRSRIGLYGKNFNWITRKDASNAGDAITLEKDILGPGWHYFAISDLDRKAHSIEYSFDPIFNSAPDPNEPNNVVGDATKIEFGQTVHGYICPVDDVDFYMLYVDTSGILQVELNNVSSDMRSRIDLYGKNFNWITRKDASNAGDAITLEKDISGSGWHYFAISDLDRKAHYKGYSFKATLRSV